MTATTKSSRSPPAMSLPDARCKMSGGGDGFGNGDGIGGFGDGFGDGDGDGFGDDGRQAGYPFPPLMPFPVQPETQSAKHLVRHFGYPPSGAA